MGTIKRKRLYYIYVLIAFMGFAPAAHGQDISVSAQLDTTEFLIGDQVGIELKVKQPINEFVGIPIFEQEINTDLEILEQSENDTTLLESGHYLIKKRLLVTVFDSGYYALPPIPFLYYTDTIRTDPIGFRVRTVPVDTSQAIKDIKMPYGAPLSFAEVFPWAGGGIALAVLILALAYIIRKLKRKEPIIKRVKPREPAHIIAYRDLDKLKAGKLWQQDKVKEYYTDLTDILRLYLWNRYTVRTLERTSEEILDSLKNIDFSDEEAFETLKDIFHVSDLVKFAKFKPLADEHEKCIEGAYKFVDRTKLIVEEKKEESEVEANEEKQGVINEVNETKVLEENSISK
ncbi:MAG: hypothetical protein C0597_08065 [Marinilabiliales bacterium]|nr:MAG: hypothetical protein C0597_08065 [Marinilabiliales bacterium]